MTEVFSYAAVKRALERTHATVTTATGFPALL